MPTDPNQRANTVKNQGITEISFACWKNSENKLKIIKMIPETKTLPPIPLIRTVMSTTITTTKTVTKLKESQKLSTHPVRHVGKQTTPQKNATLESMQPIDRLPGIEDQKYKIRYKREPIKLLLMKLLKLQPRIWTNNATSSLRSCDWQTGDNSFKTSTNSRGCLVATPGDSCT